MFSTKEKYYTYLSGGSMDVINQAFHSQHGYIRKWNLAPPTKHLSHTCVIGFITDFMRVLMTEPMHKVCKWRTHTHNWYYFHDQSKHYEIYTIHFNKDLVLEYDGCVNDLVVFHKMAQNNGMFDFIGEVSARSYLRTCVYSKLPGPSNWTGHYGGCLGLPKDVTKMILKWV